jgi:uncharacterized protein (TIGR00251 family)
VNPPWIKPHPQGVLLAIKVQPRAANSEVMGPLGNELKIRIAAPPVDSAANEALIRFISEKTGCHRQNIRIIRGHAARSKTILIHGADPATVEKGLAF